MVDKQVAMVVKIEYEIGDNREKVWTAYVMAYSQDEAVKYLAKFLKNTIKVSAVSIDAPRVDALSDEVRAGITGKSLEVEKPKKFKRPKSSKKKVDVEPSTEEVKKLKQARDKALKDLKAQGVDVYEPKSEVVKEPKEKVVSLKKPTTKKSLNIKTKK